MPRVEVDRERCKACLLCAAFCPHDNFRPAEEANSRGFHPAEFVDPENCTGCRVCALMCPDCAIEVYR